MFLTTIIVYLFVKVYIQTRTTVIAANLKRYKLLNVVLEIGVILVSLTLPVTVLWLPFRVNLYVHTGVACHLNSSSNLPTGTEVMKDIILYTPTELAGLIAIVTALGLMTQYRILRQQRVARQLIIKLILSLLIVTFFSVADTVITILWYLVKVNGHRITLARLYTSLLISSTIKIVLLFGYLLGFHYLHIHKSLKKLCQRKQQEAKRNKRNCSEYGTFRKSSRASAPSSTFFSVSHTGEFNSTSTGI